MTTIRMLFSLAACKYWKLWQLDVKNSFLYGELDRDIFMEQPMGFVSKTFPVMSIVSRRLYSSLFVKKTSSGNTMLLLCVDDMIITGDDSVEIHHLQDALFLRFEMKKLGEVNCFLGLEVKRTYGYFVPQRGYVARLLDRFGMSESNAMTTPIEPGLKLTKDRGKKLEDATLFCQLVGSLFYLTITRPDISYSVGVISQFMTEPHDSHFVAAKRILRYVKGTLNLGLLYKPCAPFLLNGFVDADWARDVNDRRSTTGYCFNIGSAAISWCSKKQSTVALSSCEAEYVASTMATQECIWLKQLITEMLNVVDYLVPI
ncbi:PREDICTED: uncharacterized protein LOC109146678 [Ipomoea nil]|uniref:uncharacterized protein LOC109146678 n=1 Tax=Ipomoea nil TaxID=35883 RepID=UPI0009018AC0|nr:PREDICTED: uncharacterized protein LOC109146678 [Ipomoea nil]